MTSQLTLKVRITFTEELLGTASGNPEVHAEFIASKAPDAPSRDEEIVAIGVQAEVEKTKTVFPKEDGRPFLWDYQQKGMLKDACGMLTRVPGTASNKLKAYKKVIDGLIFVSPRKIFLHLPTGDGQSGSCQRPLRAQTAQGERIALANSETMPAGTWFQCDIQMLDASHEKLVREWLDYGALRGLGAWRNSGKGRFTWEELQG